MKKLDDLTQNTQLKEVEEKINKEMMFNVLFAIGVFIYLAILNIAQGKIIMQRLEMDFKILSCVLAFVTVCVLEKAYKKDNTKLMYHGIEMGILAFATLTIPYYTNMFNYNVKIYILSIAYMFSSYYIFKNIVIYTKYKKKFVRSLSDISEITQKDEPVKKEATKRINLQEIQDALEKSQKEKKEDD